ncbi:T9SS type A sorting domain-containing protein [Nonlabens ponticola]|uniref:T9SS type A sorting domain-containing protein n=1 Tax=Nonlabens ponticola TaxID=2496866 RepID=A0A3S9MZK4_9FLAO|nr:T9SS type A sorting domain-containing protein [Nonlabens ponticola]AZQ44685.1 T9SS type A sorting domain-containing protein [Nonlabens ponticola]
MKKILLYLSLVIVSLSTTVISAQTEIFNLAGGGDLPQGWIGTNNQTSNSIDRSSYYLVDAGNPSDVITSSSFDLSAFATATFNVRVATFGGASQRNPALIEFSFDGGTTFTQANNTNTPQSGSSYIDGGDIVLSNVSSQVVVRISNAGVVGRGVRLRNLVLTASGMAGSNQAPIITDILQSPARNANIFSTTQVTVAADVTDADGIATNGVVLEYAVTASGDTFNGFFDQAIIMTADGDSYAAAIPVQADGSTVNYRIVATDDSAESLESTSATFDYRVMDPVPAPTLILSEIADPADNASARFVEIYNNGVEDIDFEVTPIYLARFANGNTDSQVVVLDGVLRAGAYYVIASSEVSFLSTYGFSANDTSGIINVNGNDAFGLYAGTPGSGTLFDVYGEIGVDGSGEAWEYENARAYRTDLLNNPTTVWNASQWTIATANAADATPGNVEGSTTANVFSYDNGAWSPQTPEGVAVSTDNIVILTGNAAISGDVDINNITTRSGTTLDIATNTINLNGNLDNNGDLVANEGTLNFAGSSLQTLSGSDLTVENLIINNTTGVDATAAINLEGVLTLTNGTLDTNDSFTFKSDATSSAILAPVVNGSISGNVTVEQYYPANRAFRFISSPVNMDGTIFSNWQQGGLLPGDEGFEAESGILITGGTTADGFDQSGSNNPSAYLFNNDYNYDGATSEAQRDARDAEQFTFINSDNGLATNSLSPSAGDAFNVLIRGDRTIDLTAANQSATVTTLSSTGTLATGPQSPDLSVTGGQDETFVLVGNPYQAQVDMRTVLGTGTASPAQDLNPNVYYYYLPSTQDYVEVDLLNGGTGAVTPLVQPGQAFFLLRADTDFNGVIDSQLTFEEDDKTLDTQTTATYSEPQGVINVSLGLQGDDNADELTLIFDVNETNEVSLTDIPKLKGARNQIMTTLSERAYAIERRALPVNGESIALTTSSLTDEVLTLSIDYRGLENTKVLLVDNFTSEVITLSVDNINTLQFETTDDSASRDDRFELQFESSTLSFDDDSAFAKALSLYPNPASNGVVRIANLEQGSAYNYTLVNTLGQIVRKGEISHQNDTLKNLQNLSRGLYLLNLQKENEQTTLKLILE